MRTEGRQKRQQWIGPVCVGATLLSTLRRPWRDRDGDPLDPDIRVGKYPMRQVSEFSLRSLRGTCWKPSLLSVDKAMPGLRRRDKALRLSSEPTIAIAGDDIVYGITQAAGKHGKTGEPAPWRPQVRKESQYGIGSRQTSSTVDHEECSLKIGPVQPVLGGKRQPGIRPGTDETHCLVALMPQEEMNPGATKHAVGIEDDLHSLLRKKKP